MFPSMHSGCFYRLDEGGKPVQRLLPQIGLEAHATILATNSRTVFTQTFVNPSSTEPISEVSYSFPLYESSSIVGFTCHIGDTVIEGTVKTKAKANEAYEEAKSEGKSAAVLDRSLSAADVFGTRIGNVPAAGTVVIEIILICELFQDAQTDGIRYTIPSSIAPRYGSQGTSQDPPEGCLVKTSIVVDVRMEKGSHVRSIRSPAQPIQVGMGRVSTMAESSFESFLAFVKFQENVVLREDFVITINADKQDLPFALLETHPTLPDQKAMMVSLVPKFRLPPDSSEIVFVVDRSGSMADKISTLRSALELFLKSLPLGIPFNIISFGSEHELLWPRSKMSNKESLGEALKYTSSFESNMGGTEMRQGLQIAVENRYQDKLLDVLVLTDGQVWNQSHIFDLVNQANRDHSARFFTLGLGRSVSHSLVNGISRAGKGFAQIVLKNEDMNKTVVRMLKGALMPRLLDSRLDMNVPDLDESFVHVELPGTDRAQLEPMAEPISLFDPSSDAEKGLGNLSEPLPELSIPRILQAPADLPSLFPFIRSNIYLLISHSSSSFPETIILRANSKHGPLELKIPVQDIGQGQTIHQLAAKKTINELEESRGWIFSAKDTEGEVITRKWESRVGELNQRECERLGIKFQVAGKHCSFVAVQDDTPLDSDNYESTSSREPSGSQASPRARSGVRGVLGKKKKSANAPGLDCATRQSIEPPAYVPSYASPSFAFHAYVSPGPSASSFGGLSPGYTPASPAFASASSAFSPTSSAFSPTSPAFTPTSPAFAPTSPAFAPTSPAFTPTSPDYSLASPNYSLLVSQPALGPDTEEDDRNEEIPAIPPLYKLVGLQSFEGHWEMSDDLLQTIGFDPVSTRNKIQGDYERLKGAEACKVPRLEAWSSLLATSLVCLFLEHKEPDSKDIWELLKAKADYWVQVEVDTLSPADRGIVTKVIDELAPILGLHEDGLFQEVEE